MSFYLEEDDENPRYSVGGIIPSSQKTNDDYSEGGADHFVCDNCGYTDSYLDETSGGLVCVECHTQSQTIIAASQTELEYDDTMMLAGRVSGGHFKTAAPSGAAKRRARKRLQELDHSTTLPTTEQCIIGFQRVLKHSCRQVAISFMKDCPRHVRNAAMKHCQRIWTGYLEAWMKGADFFGRLYPEIRLSFRDAFLTPGLRLKLLRTLTHKASRRVREEVMTSDNSLNVNQLQTGTVVKEELWLPIDDQNGPMVSMSVPFEVIKDNSSNVQFGYSTYIGYSSGPDDTTGAPDADKNSHSRLRSFRHSPIQMMIHRHQKLVKSKTLGRRATALLMSPSMDMAAAIVALAFRPFGVTCHNIQQWIQEGTLPLFNVFPYLPTQERKQLKLIQPFFRINEVPSVTTLEKRLRALQVASGYIPKTLVISKRNPNGGTAKEVSEKIVGRREITSTRQITPCALPLAMARAVAQLGLSQEALNNCFALTGLPICDTIDQKGHKKIEWLPKPLGKCRPDKVVGNVELAGVIVTACQFVPKWEEHWYIKADDAVGIPYKKNVTHTSMPSVVSYLQFLEDSYLVAEECSLLNHEIKKEHPQSFQEVTSDLCIQPSNATVVRSSTMLRPMEVQPISCQAVKRRGSLAVQEEGTSLRGAVPPAPLGTLIEFVSLNLGTNPLLVLRFCHELSEEMRARNLKRKERRIARKRTTG